METRAHERQIALPWIARLRWIAVIGQVAATAAGVAWLKLELPLAWIALVISITAISNLILQIWSRMGSAPSWCVPAVILLDGGLFTWLIYLTGGTDNPFSILYAIHVAMAVVVLGGLWTWLVVGLSAVSYAVISFWHRALTPPLSDPVFNFGQWSALGLVMVLIAYFVGRVMRSLRRREEELENAREHARRVEHLGALTTLAAGAAHELGTPLSTIALAAKEIERGHDPASLAEDAKLIRDEVERCRQILDRMRVDVLEDGAHRPAFETFDDLIEQLRADLRPAEQSRLIVETHEPGDTVVARARVLRRAIGVLLRNAFDASTEQDPVRLLFQRPSGRMMFTVIDNGAGMPESVLRRAGQPFFTTKQPGSGMGLGLFLVRLAAETYGGSFKLESQPGAGTKAIVDLPDLPAEEIAHEFDQQSNPAEREDPGGGRRPDVPQAAGEGAGGPGA